MQLYNKLSAEERARIIDENSQERITLSFYKYFKLGNPKIFRDHLFVTWSKLDILGRIYIANEGINAQLSVPKENINEFKETLQDIIPLNKIRLNFALEHYSKSFLKLTIKIRKKIVADGLDDKTFDVTNIGKHLDAENFNKMLNDSNTVCIDMRNHYESEIGFFKGAIKPNVDTFRESLEIIDNELENINLEMGLTIPCGLIINELMTNAIKYAFPYDTNGTLKIALRHESTNRIRLTVEDDGTGLPEGVDWQHSKGIGLRLIHILSNQIHGDYQFLNLNGTSFSLIFPERLGNE